MKPHSLVPSTSAGHTARLLLVTQKMVQKRAGELAELKGRQACDVTADDLNQARSDLARKTQSIP